MSISVAGFGTAVDTSAVSSRPAPAPSGTPSGLVTLDLVAGGTTSTILLDGIGETAALGSTSGFQLHVWPTPAFDTDAARTYTSSSRALAMGVVTFTDADASGIVRTGFAFHGSGSTLTVPTTPAQSVDGMIVALGFGPPGGGTTQNPGPSGWTSLFATGGSGPGTGNASLFCWTRTLTSGASDPGFDVTMAASGQWAGVTIFVPAGTTTPVAPTADAGTDQTVLEGDLVTLDGTGSTAGSTYSWTQTAGTSVTLSDSTAAQPTFTAPGTPGDLTFSLVVSKDGLDSDPDTVTITVTELPTMRLDGIVTVAETADATIRTAPTPAGVAAGNVVLTVARTGASTTPTMGADQTELDYSGLPLGMWVDGSYASGHDRTVTTSSTCVVCEIAAVLVGVDTPASVAIAATSSGSTAANIPAVPAQTGDGLLIALITGVPAAGATPPTVLNGWSMAAATGASSGTGALSTFLFTRTLTGGDSLAAGTIGGFAASGTWTATVAFAPEAAPVDPGLIPSAPLRARARGTHVTAWSQQRAPIANIPPLRARARGSQIRVLEGATPANIAAPPLRARVRGSAVQVRGTAQTAIASLPLRARVRGSAGIVEIQQIAQGPGLRARARGSTFTVQPLSAPPLRARTRGTAVGVHVDPSTSYAHIRTVPLRARARGSQITAVGISYSTTLTIPAFRARARGSQVGVTLTHSTDITGVPLRARVRGTEGAVAANLIGGKPGGEIAVAILDSQAEAVVLVEH